MTQPCRVNGYTRDEIDRMCHGKHRWSDELSARAGALQSLERRPNTMRLFTYKCPSCGGFHLTRCKQKGQEPVRLDAEIEGGTA